MNWLRSYFDCDDYTKVFWALFWLTLFIMLLGIGFRSPWPADELDLSKSPEKWSAAVSGCFPAVVANSIRTNRRFSCGP